MFLQELFDLLILFVLQLFELLSRLVDNLFDFRVDHHLLHLETHLGLEPEAAEFTLGLSNRDFVILHRWLLLSIRVGGGVACLVEELHDFRLIRKFHGEVVVRIQLV